MAITYPSPIIASDAILEIRNRTGNTSGQPTDDIIRRFLNRGLQNLERQIGGIYATGSEPIAQGVNTITLPADYQNVININYSTTLPTASNAVVYPIQLLQEGAFERIVGYLPSQSIGFPTYAFVQTDASGLLTLQFDGILQTAGFINVYYKQRPQQYTDTDKSVVQLDPMYEEGMIAFACAATCQNRAQYGPPLTYWNKEYRQSIDELRIAVQERTVPQRAVVADVSMDALAVPGWSDWLG